MPTKKLRKGSKPAMGKQHHRKHTPFESEVQTIAGNIARAAKEGKIPKSKLKGASLEMYKGMTKEELISHSEEAKGKKLPHRIKK